MLIARHALDVVITAPARAGAATIVFLHEGLGSAGLWRDVPARLAERTGCGTVVYSRYGNGFSEVLREPRAVSYMHDEALVTLPEIIERAGIERPILFGHSDGASIALIYAAAHPENVRALVLEAPHVVVEDLSIASIAQIGRDFEPSGLRAKMRRHHADVDATFFGWNDIWLAPAFRTWSIVDELAKIGAPVFAIQGSDDQYGTLHQLDLIAARSRGAVDRLVLARCGHAPHRERGALVVGAVADWLLEAPLSL